MMESRSVSVQIHIAEIRYSRPRHEDIRRVYIIENQFGGPLRDGLCEVTIKENMPNVILFEVYLMGFYL